MCVVAAVFRSIPICSVVVTYLSVSTKDHYVVGVFVTRILVKGLLLFISFKLM